MKPPLTLALLAALLLTGCARPYTITLNNGRGMTTQGKPKLQNGSYIFKDASGQPGSVPASRVQEVSPSNMTTSRTSSGFKAEPTR